MNKCHSGFIKFRTLIFDLILVGLVVGLGFFVFNLVKERKLFINEWFIGNALKGVDISSYQADVDMKTLANQGIRFVYMKATEGSSYVDEKFKTNWQNVAETNMAAGAYHFFSFESSGETQANNYIATVGELSGKLIPAIDVEMYGDYVKNPPDHDKVVRELKILATVLEDEYKKKPMFYAQRDVYEKYLRADFNDYPKWVRNVFFPVVLEFGNDWTIWQYKDRGELEGYSGNEKYIDLDVLNPDKKLEDLILE